MKTISCRLTEMSILLSSAIWRKNMHFQGAGSSHIHATLTDEPFPHFPGTCAYEEGYDENGEASKEQIAEAVRTAEKSDKVVIFAGLPTSHDSRALTART